LPSRNIFSYIKPDRNLFIICNYADKTKKEGKKQGISKNIPSKKEFFDFFCF